MTHTDRTTRPASMEYFSALDGAVLKHRVTRNGKAVFSDTGNHCDNVMVREETIHQEDCDAEYTFKNITKGYSAREVATFSKVKPTAVGPYPTLEKVQKFRLPREILDFRGHSYFLRSVSREPEVDAVAFRDKDGRLQVICDSVPLEFPMDIGDYFPRDCPALHLKIHFVNGGLQFKGDRGSLEFQRNTIVNVGVFDIISPDIKYRGDTLLGPPTFMRMKILSEMFTDSSEMFTGYNGEVVELYRVPAVSIDSSAGLVQEMDRLFLKGKARIQLQRVDTKYRTSSASSNILETTVTREALLLLTHWVQNGSY